MELISQCAAGERCGLLCNAINVYLKGLNAFLEYADYGYRYLDFPRD